MVGELLIGMASMASGGGLGNFSVAVITFICEVNLSAVNPNAVSNCMHTINS